MVPINEKTCVTFKLNFYFSNYFETSIYILVVSTTKVIETIENCPLCYISSSFS